MNDFTKDELKFIWHRLAIADYQNCPEMLELPNKVCAMIDNYCDCDYCQPDEAINDNQATKDCAAVQDGFKGISNPII